MRMAIHRNMSEILSKCSSSVLGIYEHLFQDSDIETIVVEEEVHVESDGNYELLRKHTLERRKSMLIPLPSQRTVLTCLCFAKKNVVDALLISVKRAKLYASSLRLMKSPRIGLNTFAENNTQQTVTAELRLPTNPQDAGLQHGPLHAAGLLGSIPLL
jgi:hypothetical protein